MKLVDTLSFSVSGHVIITAYTPEDFQTRQNGIILFDDHNEIHNENFGVMLIRGIADKNHGNIDHMAFGDGGCTINSDGSYTCLAPNVTGTSAALYNHISALDQSTTSQSSAFHMAGSPFADIEIRACIDSTNQGLSPAQQATDSAVPNFSDTNYPINELGLFTNNNTLLTHVTFPPVFKTGNRVIEVVYKIRIRHLTPNIPLTAVTYTA